MRNAISAAGRCAAVLFVVVSFASAQDRNFDYVLPEDEDTWVIPPTDPGWQWRKVKSKALFDRAASETEVRYKVEMDLNLIEIATGLQIQLGNSYGLLFSSPTGNVVIQAGTYGNLRENTDYDVYFFGGGQIQPGFTSKAIDFTSARVPKAYTKLFRNDTEFKWRVQVWDGEPFQPTTSKIYDRTYAPGQQETVVLRTSKGGDLRVLYTVIGATLEYDAETDTYVWEPSTGNSSFSEIIYRSAMSSDTGQAPANMNGSASTANGVAGVGGSSAQPVGSELPSGSTSTSGVTGAEMAKNTAAVVAAIGASTWAIVDAVQDASDNGGGGGTGDGTDVTGIETRLDTLNERNQLGKPENVIAATDAVTDHTGNASSKVSDLASNLDGEFSALMNGRMPDPLNIPVGASVSLQVELPDLPTVDMTTPLPNILELNPLESEYVPDDWKDVVAWVRAFIGWCVVLGFYTHAFRSSREAMGYALMTGTQQETVAERAASVVPVVGAPMVFAVRIAMISIVVAAVITLPSAFVQLASTDWTTLLNTFASEANGVSGGASLTLLKALAIANQFVPLATFLSVATSYFAFELLVMPLQAFWQFFFRFLPV